MQIKNNFKIITFFVLTLVVTSCEKVVKVDVPEAETLLVIDAWVNNKSATQTIRLTTTAPVFDGSHTPPANGASVAIRDLTNGKIFSFIENSGTGNYTYTPTATDTLCIANHHYELSVIYKNNLYTASTLVGRAAKIDTVAFNKINNPGSTVIKGYLPWLFGRDIPKEHNYYWIKSYQNGVFYNQSAVINMCEDAGGGPTTDSMCFVPPNAYYNVVPYDVPLQLNDVYTVEIYAINKESFEYLMQLKTQLSNSQAGLFAATPQNLRTNIIPSTATTPRALGWFNMGTLNSKSFVCKDIPLQNIYASGYYCP